MADSTTPDAPAENAAEKDPLAGDWSEGLRGPIKALGIPEPRRIPVEGVAAPPPSRPMAMAQPAPAEEVEAPDAWGAVGEDPLQSEPPPLPNVIVAPEMQATSEPPPDVTPATGAPAFLPDVTPATGAPAFFPDVTPASPAPAFESFSEPPDEVVELLPEDEAEHAAAVRSEIEGAEPIVELKAEDEAPAADGGWGAAPADDAAWSTLSKAPDWSAPAAPAPALDADWGAPPPVHEASSPAEPQGEAVWAAPAEAAAPTSDWTAPPPAPEKLSWANAGAGNNTLAQMEGEPEPIPAEPGAAEQLFGTVPVGGSLSEESEDELPDAEEIEDPDLPVAVPETSSPEDADLPAAEIEDADLAAALQEPETEPIQMEGLKVPGEHRVAVHTRGGSTRRGTVKDVDLAQSGFSLVPQGGGADEPVSHDEVKAIFFMLPPGVTARPGSGGKVKVTFADGRSIEGERDGSEGQHGFFLVPTDAARTNTWRIYVAREATSEIRDL